VWIGDCLDPESPCVGPYLILEEEVEHVSGHPTEQHTQGLRRTGTHLNTIAQASQREDRGGVSTGQLAWWDSYWCTPFHSSLP
jgi:hypothetical protein